MKGVLSLEINLRGVILGETGFHPGKNITVSCISWIGAILTKLCGYGYFHMRNQFN